MVKNLYQLEEAVLKIIIISKMKGNVLKWFCTNDYSKLSTNQLLTEMELMFNITQ